MRKSVYSRYRSYKAPPYSYYLRQRHDLEYKIIALEMILRVLTTERRVGYSYCKMLQSMKTTQTKARISPGAYISTAHRSLFDRWAVFTLIQFNPSIDVPEHPAHTAPNHRQAPTVHIPRAYYRSASPVLTADTYCLQLHSPRQSCRWRSYCHR